MKELTRTELHRHLDASFRPSTLLEYVKKFKIDAPFKTEEEIRTHFWITKQMGSLKEVLDCFVLFQKVLCSGEVLERVAREAVEDASREGIKNLELRYSPTFTGEFCNLSWGDALSSFQRGLDEGSKKTGVHAGLICILSRGYGVDLATKTIEFAVAHKDKFIGVDLAGLEEGYPCRLYKDIFRIASDAHLPITIHAGEATGPDNVWEAIDILGANRIGHGIRSIEDKELMKRLARDEILLETCPTSNYITRSVTDWQSHPLPKFLDAGIPVSVSTDDPGIFGTTLDDEYERCKTYLHMSDADLKKVDEHAFEHSFLKNR